MPGNKIRSVFGDLKLNALEKSEITVDFDNVLYEYFSVIDHALRTSPYAYKPAKSTDFEKVDQTLLNHVRNGISAIIDLNKILVKRGSLNILTEEKLKEVIALFSIHDYHKLVGREFREQFDLSEDEVMLFAHSIHADSFAPDLKPFDFFSVIQHHTTIGFHDELSNKFYDYRYWFLLADALSSLEYPRVDANVKHYLKKIDPSFDFYYHTFSESIGLLSNIINTTVSDWLSSKDLTPFLYFENGILYLGPANTSVQLQKPDEIEEIYVKLKEKIQSSHENLSYPEKLQNSLQIQGSKGLYSVEESFFFYAGINTVTKAFLQKAALSKESEKLGKIDIETETPMLRLLNSNLEMQYPPADKIKISREEISGIIIDGKTVETSDVTIICHGDEIKPKKYVLIPDKVIIEGDECKGKISIEGIGLLPSMVGYKVHILQDFGVDIGWNERIIPYSRAISGIRKDVITELIKYKVLPSNDPLLETCRLFQVSDELTTLLIQYSKNNAKTDHHIVGGFWNYSYVIAADLLNRSINGIKLIELSSHQEKMKYLNSLVDSYLSKISEDKLEIFEVSLLYPYREKLIVWICENLNINGSMLYGAFENKTNKFLAYCDGSGICRLTNDTPYEKERKTPSKDVSMLKYNFSNHVPVGSTEPSLYVSVPIQMELTLRSIGHGLKKTSDKIYFRLIPDYFFSTTTSRIFSQFASLFEGDASTKILDIAHEFLSDNLPNEDSLVSLMISETGRKNLCQYIGHGFEYQNSTFDFIFNKRRKGDGEYWFFGTYLALVLAMVTGCRVVVGENPICMTRGDEFNEFVALEAPHVAIKRIFSDRISIIEPKNENAKKGLKHTLKLASLIISMGYEIKMDDAAFLRFLQAFRNHMFPGSTLLKQIKRIYEQDKKKGGIGSFINRLRGIKHGTDDVLVKTKYPGFLQQAILLDRYGEWNMVVNSIHELARLGINVAIPKKYDAYKVEHLFRESVKAVLAKKSGTFPREDYIDAVSGRLRKMLYRVGSDQFSRIEGLKDFNLILVFSEYFIDHIFYKISSGDPGKLKRLANDLADGYYSATLQLREEYYTLLRETKSEDQTELSKE